MTRSVSGDSSDTFPLSFGLHPGFQPVDFNESSADRAERLFESARSALPGLTEEQCLRLVVANEYLVRRMAEEGIIYAASFVGRSARDTTAATTAQFTLTLREADLKATRPLEALAAGLREQDARREVDFVDLAVGRCLAVVQQDTPTPEVNLTGAEHHEPRVSRQLRVIVPLVERSQLAIFGLVTECLRDWEDYVAMMAEICNSIRWRGSARSSIEDKLAGLL
ncbi:hypothetical protein SAMN04487905_101476 [Actinopolyspora xinjiangensis]|uniref:Uncharacterized protein n=1 Tax=Actinopolyspora xinjiangensis TaxID=405564 RepID=A0A1H0PB62_9ACTN|nr:hypothetical protein [Actinopolyspora xinjiangensis]SDP02367.1 hypothetical protein SAMN04487905_101476 [Actinopolyspora xinjiangensis]